MEDSARKAGWMDGWVERRAGGEGEKKDGRKENKVNPLNAL